MPRARTVAISAVFGASLLTSGASAFAAPDKQACVDAATRGQIQRDDLKLAAAAEAFAACAAASCPATVRKSCLEWLDGVRAKMPTVTIQLADSGAARLRIDGEAVSFGTETTLDTGLHTLRVDAPGREPLTQDFTLGAGDRKTVALTFPEPNETHEVVSRPVPLSVWILGGVAVLGLSSFAGFGLVAKFETDRLTKECAPACSNAARDSAFRNAAIADVSLVVGTLVAITAGVLLVTRPTQRRVSVGSNR
jgi:hypothetical protein